MKNSLLELRHEVGRLQDHMEEDAMELAASVRSIRNEVRSARNLPPAGHAANASTFGPDQEQGHHRQEAQNVPVCHSQVPATLKSDWLGEAPFALRTPLGLVEPTLLSGDLLRKWRSSE
eukprot:4985313-Amphidinium_carterae.1